MYTNTHGIFFTTATRFDRRPSFCTASGSHKLGRTLYLYEMVVDDKENEQFVSEVI